MSKFRKKVDLNHAEIVEGLRKLDYKVYSTHKVGEDFPDILVAHPIYPISFLVEIKSSPKAKISDGQISFSNDYYSIIGYSIEDIINKINIKIDMFVMKVLGS